MTRQECLALKPGDVVYTTKGCPDANPARVTVTRGQCGGIGATYEARNGAATAAGNAFLHLTEAAALAHFEELRKAAIERVQKQIKTLPNRLRKLQARKPVIK